jgi:diguanylate cyclase (GGDEF)-like protein
MHLCDKLSSNATRRVARRTMHDLDADALPVGVVRLDDDDRVVAVNAWFRQWAGDPSPEGSPLDDLLVPIADFLEDVGQSSTMMAATRNPGRFALVARSSTPDGSVLTVLDSTDRYRAGDALRRSHVLADRTQNRLQLIIDAAIAFADATSEDRLAEILAVTAAQAYRAEQSVVFLVGEDGRTYQRAGENPFEGLLSASVLAAAASDLQEVVKFSGSAEAARLSPLLAEAMDATGVLALIAAPIHLDDSHLGFFACFFHHPRTFDEEAAPLAEALANQAAQKLTTERLRRRLEHAAMHDETTSLPNRRRLEQLAIEVGHARPVSAIFIDLDGFKEVNDQLGHDRGDDVLREVAERLLRHVRDSDVVARYGGDEFVVVCDADTDAALEVAERLRQSIEEPYACLPEHMGIGASIGVATAAVPHTSFSVDRLIRSADQAMYTAKSQGGNRVALAA